MVPFTGCSLNGFCSSYENKFHESQCFQSPGQKFSSHLQMSVALPTAFQVDSISSFKEKLFHPQLCSAGTRTFAIYSYVMCRGWKQRKCLEIAKIYIESRQKYTFLLSRWMSQCVPPGLVFWSDLLITPCCTHGTGQAVAACLYCWSRGTQHGMELWLLKGYPTLPKEFPSNLTFKCSTMSCVFYIHKYNIIFRSSLLAAVRFFL